MAIATANCSPCFLALFLHVLDRDAALTVAEGAWPDARNEDELHDALKSMIVIPAAHPRITSHSWKTKKALNEFRGSGPGEDLTMHINDANIKEYVVS